MNRKQKTKSYFLDEEHVSPSKKGKKRLTFVIACLVIPVIYPVLSALYSEPSTYTCYIDEKVLEATTTNILRAQSIPVFKLVSVSDLYPWLQKDYPDIAPIRDIDSITNVLNVTKISDHYAVDVPFRTTIIRACVNATKIVIKAQLMFAYGLGGCNGVNDTADTKTKLPKPQVTEYCDALDTPVGIALMENSVGPGWNKVVCHHIFEQDLPCYKIFTNYQASKSAMSAITGACASIDSLVASAAQLAKASSTQCNRVWWVGILDWVGSYSVKTAIVVFMSGVMWQYNQVMEGNEMNDLGASLLDDQDAVAK